MGAIWNVFVRKRLEILTFVHSNNVEMRLACDVDNRRQLKPMKYVSLRNVELAIWILRFCEPSRISF